MWSLELKFSHLQPFFCFSHPVFVLRAIHFVRVIDMHWLCRSCNTCSACFSQSKSLFSNIMSHVTSCPVSRIPLNYIQLINPSFSGLRYRIRMRLAEERWLCICSHPWKWNGVGESSYKIADHLYTYWCEAKVFKEARLLHQLNHKNVVLFKKVCIAPPAIMLGYVHFAPMHYVLTAWRISLVTWTLQMQWLSFPCNWRLRKT